MSPPTEAVRLPGVDAGQNRNERGFALAAALALSLALAACRNAESGGGGGGIGLPIVPNADGSSGCNGPQPTLVPPQVATPVDLAGFVLGPASQVAAARDAQVLYVTGADASLAVIDVSDPDAPLVTTLVSPGTVATLLLDLGVTQAPELSGLAVLSGELLVVMEHSANVLLSVDRLAPDQVALLAGLPSAVPGFADGPTLPNPLAARFSFDRPSMVVPVERQGGGKQIFVADSGNHAIRLVSGGQVSTLFGDGLPQTLDGRLGEARLDTPVGLVATCTNSLLVTEAGAFGDGHVLRRLGLQSFGPFATLDGELLTILGQSGVSETLAGGKNTARLASPMAPATSAGGPVFWIDAATGVLRRFEQGQADCPLELDCAAALATPSFTPGGVHSLALLDSGALYVLDADAGSLLRVTP